ncbi:hypothetical protein CVV68_21565 [Arthrobacter livingstonensis]|uniref:Uncharacterized protein n=1 Tax=Arthrobacter livingstonensis TaxID=670078 RepID=A0A2V5L0Q6_9MICC|nr:hypothetical protein [Arthrobacter livingstonensis]PYI64588.1 hypothetical protein CVV68_21565 [Arthrobacter livingstonensis]
MKGTDLAVGEPVRRRAGLVILASLALACLFAAVTVVSKETPALALRQPWQDDPYDVLVSLDFVLLPLLVALGVLRVQLCRRYELLPVRRLVDVLRVAGAALGVCLATELAEWVAVALGRHRASWTTVTGLQLAALTVLTALTITALMLVRRASRRVMLLGRAASQPDWLADAVAVGVRAAGVLGRDRGWALAVVRWTDARVITRVRTQPIAAAGILAVLLALPFVAAKVVIECYPAPLVILSFVFLAGSLFAFVVVIGAYLLLVPPRRATPPAWLITAVVAFTAGTVTFAFHDSLLTHQTVSGLGALYFGAALAAATVSLALQKLGHLRTPPAPRR